MYREFVYMDADRVQSVIAQLKEGLLTEIVAGKASQLEGRARLAAGVLSHLFPIGIEGAASHSSNSQSSKVLHDYAYSIALEALQDNDMLLEVDDWDRDNLPLPDNAFVLVRGDIEIIDYNILRELAEHEQTIDALISSNNKNDNGTTNGQQETLEIKGLNRHQRRAFASQQQKRVPTPPASAPTMSAFQQMRQFMDAFMGDVVLARALDSTGLIFVGPLIRASLREDIRHYILKRGGTAQEGWAMLGQVSLIPDETSKLAALAAASTVLTGDMESATQNASTALDLLTTVIQPMYKMQEAIASISYPAIAVTPIAIYRELGKLR